jgi:mRNA interferase RelE/StbE
MTYTARFSKSFLKKQKLLPAEVKTRVLVIVKETLVNPYSGIALVGPLKGLWKIRVGKYRITYEVDDKEKAVFFIDIDLRKRVYN